MQVIATAQGFDGIQLRDPGAIFDMPDGTEPASWFVPVDKDGKPGKWPQAALDAQAAARAARAAKIAAEAAGSSPLTAADLASAIAELVGKMVEAPKTPGKAKPEKAEPLA